MAGATAGTGHRPEGRPEGGRERRPGRRPGPNETREAILAAARELFAEKGYDGASLRAIARQAGVDPALVHHYYGGKEGVFVAAMRFPVNPAEVLARIAEAPPEQLGATMARTFLGIWSDPVGRGPVLALLRSAMTSEQGATMMREFIGSALLARAAQLYGVPPIRVQAAAGQMIGVVILRYVLRTEPLASVGEEELVELLGPALQAYFDPGVRDR